MLRLASATTDCLTRLVEERLQLGWLYSDAIEEAEGLHGRQSTSQRLHAWVMLHQQLLLNLLVCPLTLIVTTGSTHLAVSWGQVLHPPHLCRNWKLSRTPLLIAELQHTSASAHQMPPATHKADLRAASAHPNPCLN